MHQHQLGKRTGDVLGNRYLIISTLGSGGTSIVYLAEDLRLAGKRWAVKETRLSGEEALAHSAEAGMLIRLNHPNLPEIVDYYPADPQGYSYLVTDYIEGETLLQRFERQARRMPAGQIIGYALQLCDLFHYLHGRKPEPIIYRDLKPANLMIDIEERLRLIDFGIARSFKAGQSADTVRVGTVGFAAPEQFEGRQTDERTDLYGLGALLYFLLSGGHFYHAARKQLRELDAGLPASLAALVEKLLQAEPDARCQSAAEVRGELQRVLAEQRERGGAAESGQPARTDAACATGGTGVMAQPPLVLAVGALYAGAGATFTALAIARVLHRLGVPHAVLEAPGQQPELYALLFGEKHAPAGYRCYNEAEADGVEPLRKAAWADGCTLWLPAAALPYKPAAAAVRYKPREAVMQYSPPASGITTAAVGAGDRDDVAAIDWPRLLSDVSCPVILIDIGSDWQQAAASGLLETATDLIYVVDPLLHKLELGSARRNLRRLAELRTEGKRIFGFANKAVVSGHTGQWLRVLPEQPVCLLPFVDYAKLAEASWLGVLAQERPGIRQPLNRALQRWLRGWLRNARTTDKPTPDVRQSSGPQAGGGSPLLSGSLGSKGMLHKLWRIADQAGEKVQ